MAPPHHHSILNVHSSNYDPILPKRRAIISPIRRYNNMPLAKIMEILGEMLGDRMGEFMIPPPVFTSMNGEFVDFDLEEGVLRSRFPVMEEFLNPYGVMQGGMIAAAVDNTLGPLSMLVAPPNVTRHLEMKYSSPVSPDLEHIVVTARFLEREDKKLSFNAVVRDPNGKLLAKARASHWIVD
jgi:acyl-coenzyme A thioesterase PaaI-like protein